MLRRLPGSLIRITVPPTVQRIPPMTARTRSVRLGVEALEDRRVLNADIAVVDVTTPDFTHLDVLYSISGEDSPAFELRAYISSDPVLDAADVLLSGRQAITNPTDLTA